MTTTMHRGAIGSVPTSHGHGSSSDAPERWEYVSATVATFLLIGNLLPGIGTVTPAVVAAVLAVPLILLELINALPRIHRVVWLIVPLFGAVYAHSILYPPLFDYADEKLWKFLTATLLTALAAILIRDRKSVVALGQVWVGAAMLLAVVGLVTFQGGRAIGFGANPIWVARALGAGLVFAVWLIGERELPWRPGVPMVIVIIIGLLATGSRGPTLAVAAGIVLLATFAREFRLIKSLGLVISGGLAYYAIMYLPFFETSRFRELLVQGDDSYARQHMWSTTLAGIENNPEGVGIGNWPVRIFPGTQFMYPHNIFLEVFAEFGVYFGIGFVVLVVILLGRVVWRAGRDRSMLIIAALFAGEVINSSVSGDLNGRTFFFFLVLAAIFRVSRRPVERGLTVPPEESPPSPPVPSSG